MGRSPCCDESGLKKGPWTPEEDQKLAKYIHNHGHGSWRALPKLAGLNRCGKSCRLRWTNYLRPDIKRGKFSQEEEQTILNLHSVLGNKWSAIASHLPGRTDNEIKNFWNTHLKKKLIQMGFDPMTHRPRTDIFSSLQNLLAFANLKDLVDQHHSWEEQAVRLQAEAAQMATIQYLQYLLQPPAASSVTNINNNFSNSTNNFNLAADMDQAINLLNTITAIPSLESSDSIPFAHLPELQIPGGFRSDDIPSVNKDMVQSSEFTMFSNEENSHTSDPWSLIPSSSSPISPLSAPLMAAENNSSNNLGDVCSSSSYGGGGGGPSSSSGWPELLLEDPLFHEIA